MGQNTKENLKVKNKLGLWLVGAILALSTMANAQTGAVILGGDDLTDHGGRDCSAMPNVNLEGWLYMEKALVNISAQATRPGPYTATIAALGSSQTPVCGNNGNAGAAIGSAADKAGMTVLYYDGPAAINQFFTDLASGAVNVKIIWTAGTGASNDLDSSEGSALTSNANAINAFVASGGGLLSHGSGTNAYGWLSALLPGIVETTTCDNPVTLTPTGMAAFPGLTNADVDAGPCHSTFSGNLGGLGVLARDGNGLNVIIGGLATGGGGIIGGGGHHPPHTISCTFPNQTIGVASNLTLTTDLSGANAWFLIGGSLPPGLTLSSGGVISGTPTAAGTYQYQVRANNNSTGGTVSAGCHLTVDAATVIAPTITTSCPLSQLTTGVAATRTLAANGTGPMTWTISSGALPATMTLSGNVISGTPLHPGTYLFGITATNSAGSNTVSCSVVVANAPAPPPPPPTPTITTACPLPNGVVGTAYSQSFAASSGTAPYTFALISGALGSGLSFSNGTVSGTPTHPGTHSFTVRVTDANSQTATKSCSVTVDPDPATLTPTITTACPLPGASINTAYSTSLAATNGQTPYTFSIVAGTGSLPTGVSLAANGAISGTPTVSGTFNFTLNVADSANRHSHKACSLVVAAAPPPPPVPQPSITTSCPLPAGTINAAYSTSVAATGGTPGYTFSISGGVLPVGLSINSGTGAITGTPSIHGLFTFNLVVTDSNSQVASKACSAFINHAAPTTPPTITTSCPLPAGNQNVAYNQTINATGGTAPLTFSVIAGSLPAGLTLSSAGVLSGTPTGSGTSFFTLNVRDAALVQHHTACSLNIVAAPAPPPPTPAALAITSSCPLPTGTESIPYGFTFAGTGGVPGYTWSIISGELPRPLTMASNGHISGAPFHAGTYNFTVQLRDSANTTVTRACAVTVNPHHGGVVVASRGSWSLRDTEDADVKAVEFSLAEALPFAVRGRMILDVTRADNEDDADVVFSTGGRTVDFMIPAGSTSAVFPAETLAVKTGEGRADFNLIVVLEAGETKFVVDFGDAAPASRGRR
jgi:hypothetical protein